MKRVNKMRGGNWKKHKHENGIPARNNQNQTPSQSQNSPGRSAWNRSSRRAQASGKEAREQGVDLREVDVGRREVEVGHSEKQATVRRVQPGLPEVAIEEMVVVC